MIQVSIQGVLVLATVTLILGVGLACVLWQIYHDLRRDRDVLSRAVEHEERAKDYLREELGDKARERLNRVMKRSREELKKRRP